MAVNINSTPQLRPNGDDRPISTVNYPLYSTWNLSLSGIYDDFHYDINLNDENGLVNKFQVIAVDNDLFGNLSVNNYVDSYQQVDINSKIEDISNVPNQLKTYQLEIIPFNNKVAIPSQKTTTDTFTLMKGYRNSDDFFENNQLLINHKPKKLTTNSYFTNKSFKGNFNPSNAKYKVDFDNVYFIQTKPNGDIIEFRISTSIALITLNYNTLTDIDNMMLELPVGPKNIMLKDRYIVRTVIGGTTTLVKANGPITIEDGDTYTYQTKDDGTAVSDIYTIIVEDCTNRYEPTNVIFNTDTYSFNAFTFYDKKSYIIKNKQDTYLSDNHQRDSVYYLKTPADQDTVIYKDDITEIVILNTGWLTKANIIELQQLWVATKIRYQDGDELVPIIFDKIEKEVYNEKDKGLKKYTVAFKKANKKYFI